MFVVVALAACERTSEEPASQAATDTFVQAPNPRVDVVLVVSAVAESAVARDALAASAAEVQRPLDESGVDWQLGVVSAAFDATDPDGGALVGDPPILRTGDDLATALPERLPGGADSERGIAVAAYAVSPPMTLEGLGGPNEGLVRHDAALAVVFVSATDDEDGGPVAPFVEDLAAVKDDRTMLVAAAVVGVGTGCEAREGARYADVARLSGGPVADVCEPDWASTSAAVGLAAAGVHESFQLAHAAQPGTIEVDVDSDAVPHGAADGWTYDEVTWFVTFHGDAVPERGARIEVTYDVDATREAPIVEE